MNEIKILKKKNDLSDRSLLYSLFLQHRRV